MNKTSNYLQLLVGISIAVVAMYFALREVEFERFLHLVTQAFSKSWAWLLATGALFLIQQYIRAYRQMLLLRSRFPQHDYRTSLSSLCIGFFFINTLPIRMGEVVRPIQLQAQENIPLSNGFAMVFTERIIDLVAALVMFLIVIGYADFQITDDPTTMTVIKHGQNLAIFGLPILLFLLLIFDKKYIKWVPVGKSFLIQFTEAIEAQRKQGRLLTISLLTVVTWGLTGFMYVTAAHAFGVQDQIGYVEGIGVLAFTMIGMAAPNAPGFAGVYEASFMAALALFGCTDENVNFAMAFTFHWWIYLIQSATAFYFLKVDQINISKIWNDLVQTRSNSSP